MMISDEVLQQVLADWGGWSQQSERLVPRSILNRFHLSADVVTVIQGVRRCGKSTLLRQLMQTHEIPAESAVFVNFEDPRLFTSLNTDLLDQIFSLSVAGSTEALTFFFDEIQDVTHWQKWMNVQLAKKTPHRFVITGSNSQLLSGELASSLTGRHLRYELFPFDYAEFRQREPDASVETFIRSGGFPAVLDFPEPERLLQQYFVDILEKDIRERVQARSSRPLQAVAKMVLESVGSEMSLRRIAGRVGLSPDTVSHYLQACEDAYLIFGCPFFAYSEAQRMRHNRKFYAIDTAMRRAISSLGGQDLGKDFENLVFLLLRRKTSEISYWRGKGEVDFVVNSATGAIPIQVTYGEPQQRHEDSLAEFYQAFPHANEAIMVTPETLSQLDRLELH